MVSLSVEFPSLSLCYALHGLGFIRERYLSLRSFPFKNYICFYPCKNCFETSTVNTIATSK